MRSAISGRTRALLGGLCLVSMLAGPLASPTAAAPRSAGTVAGIDGYGTTIPIFAMGKLVADPGTGRIFVASYDGVVVLSPSGQLLKSIALARTDDIVAGGGAIWAVMGQANTITRIDPATLVTKKWTMATPYGMYGIAYAGGAVWTTAESGTVQNVRRLDPVAGTWTRYATTYHATLRLASSPLVPNTLVVGERGDSGSHHLLVLDVSATAPVQTAEIASETPFLTDLAISGDGLHLLEATESSTDSLLERSLSDLSLTHTVAQAGGLDGVATSPVDGGTAALAPRRNMGGNSSLPDVVLYRHGSWTSPVPARLVANAQDGVEDIVAMSGNGKQAIFLGRQAGSTPNTEVRFLPIDPTIRSVSSTVLGTRGGAVVKVTGTSLGNVTAAHLGAATSPATATTPTAASFTAPPLAAGSYPLSLTVGASTATGPPMRVAALGPFRAGTTFVDRQFADIVGRAPTATERATWASRLGAGTTPGALPAGLVTSPSQGLYRAPMIRMYRAIYLQTPSLPTLTYWADRYRMGTKLSAIADYFAVSRYGSMPSREFVDQVFRAVLGRPATSAELTQWANQMHAGMTRGEVLVYFSESKDNITRQTPVVRLSELYLGMLRRAPSTAEITTGLAVSGGLPAVATQILLSAPYAARYPNG